MGVLKALGGWVELAGWCLVVWAAWRVSEPLGLAVLGALLIVAGAALGRQGR